MPASRRTWRNSGSGDADLAARIADYEAQLSKVEEIKELYYERKALEAEIERGEDTIKDIRASIANLAETNWWLPAADTLVAKLDAAEAEIVAAEEADRERYKLQFKIDQIEKQLGTGVCPACGQPVSVHNEAELKAELERLQQELAEWPAKSIDDARRQRDRLRPFGRAASVLAASLRAGTRPWPREAAGGQEAAAHAADLRADQ